MSALDQSLTSRLISLRRAQGWPLEALAERTGISRATLSRIERGDTSPTAHVLGKLATAYRLSMAELFGGVPHGAEQHIPRQKQAVWQDPETGFQRRAVVPAASGYRGAVIEGTLPPGSSISYDAPPVPGLEHHLVLLQGALRVVIGPDQYDLQPGDALRFRLDTPNSYTATGETPARYILTVITP